MMLEIKGVKIDLLNYELLQSKIETIFERDLMGLQHFVTVNPEYVLEAQRNEKFKEVLNNANLRLVDGIGILAALDYLSRAEPESKAAKMVQFGVSCVDVALLKQKCIVDGVRLERITGIDFVSWLCGLNVMKGRKVFLLGGWPESVGKEAAAKLQERYPETKFGCNPGHENVKQTMQSLRSGELDADSQRIIEEIREFGTDVLLVAYGHPWQDLWIDLVRERLSGVRLAGGVGGSFDYLAGNVARAPTWMSEMGLEWVYRLSRQPERFPRIMDATWRFAQILTD